MEDEGAWPEHASTETSDLTHTHTLLVLLGTVSDRETVVGFYILEGFKGSELSKNGSLKAHGALSYHYLEHFLRGELFLAGFYLKHFSVPLRETIKQPSLRAE